MARTRHHQEQPLATAIKLFQHFAKLNETGLLDEATVRMMQMPRCGHPDLYDDGRFLLESNRTQLSQAAVRAVANMRAASNRNQSIRTFRNKRYALQGSKWPKSKLRFKVGKYPKYPSMTRDMIDSELQRAFDLWSNASDVEFEQIKDTDGGFLVSASVKPTFMDLLLFDESSFLTTKQNSASASSSSQPVDIEIRFETGYHGDSEPFDGSGLILGNLI